MFAVSFDSSINQQVWDFLLSGGFFMLFIVLCSLVSVAIIVHRLLSLKREGVMPGGLVRAIESGGQGDVDIAALRRELEGDESSLGVIVETAIDESSGSAEEASRAAEGVAREEVLKLQTGLTILEDVITIAPLLGLLGTVSGLVGVFAELGAAGGGEADPQVLAGGIARALNTTVAGLAVAVPTVVARSFFTKRIETMAARMEVLVGRLIQSVYRVDPPSEEATPAAGGATSPFAAPVGSPPALGAPQPQPQPEPERDPRPGLVREVASDPVTTVPTTPIAEISPAPAQAPPIARVVPGVPSPSQAAPPPTAPIAAPPAGRAPQPIPPAAAPSPPNVQAPEADKDPPPASA